MDKTLDRFFAVIFFGFCIVYYFREGMAAQVVGYLAVAWLILFGVILINKKLGNKNNGRKVVFFLGVFLGNDAIPTKL